MPSSDIGTSHRFVIPTRLEVRDRCERDRDLEEPLRSVGAARWDIPVERAHGVREISLDVLPEVETSLLVECVLGDGLHDDRVDDAETPG
jgi:hypothetical protein